MLVRCENCRKRFRAKDELEGRRTKCPACGKVLVITCEQAPAYDVFISYAHEDKTTAEAACAALERAGMRCWIAPRDIVPGLDWGAAIIGAIKHCRTMVLIFSSHSNESQQVKREVERAADKGIPIVPFRVEDVVPSETMEYFISSHHWLDAFTPPLEEHLDELVAAVKALLSPERTPHSDQPPGADRTAVRTHPSSKSYRSIIDQWRSRPWVTAIAGGVLAILLLAVILAIASRPATPDVAATATPGLEPADGLPDSESSTDALPDAESFADSDETASVERARAESRRGIPDLPVTPAKGLDLAHQPPKADRFAHAPGTERFAADEARPYLDTFCDSEGTTYFALTLRPQGAIADVSPRDVVLAFDTSASMDGEYRDEALAALGATLESLSGEDRVHLMAADAEPLSMNSGFVGPKSEEMVGALAKLKERVPGGDTDMQKLLAAAADGYENDSENARAMVYFGPGDNTSFVDTVAVERSDIPVSSCPVGPEVNMRLLRLLAARTGGVVVDPADDVGVKLAAAVHVEVLWPESATWPGAFGEVYPRPVPPIRIGCDLVVIGTYRGEPEGPFEVEMTFEGIGAAKELTWQVVANPPEPKNWYLARFVEAVRFDGGLSLPILGTQPPAVVNSRRQPQKAARPKSPPAVMSAERSEREEARTFVYQHWAMADLSGVEALLPSARAAFSELKGREDYFTIRTLFNVTGEHRKNLVTELAALSSKETYHQLRSYADYLDLAERLVTFQLEMAEYLEDNLAAVDVEDPDSKAELLAELLAERDAVEKTLAVVQLAEAHWVGDLTQGVVERLALVALRDGDLDSIGELIKASRGHSRVLAFDQPKRVLDMEGPDPLNGDPAAMSPVGPPSTEDAFVVEPGPPVASDNPFAPSPSPTQNDDPFAPKAVPLAPDQPTDPRVSVPESLQRTLARGRSAPRNARLARWVVRLDASDPARLLAQLDGLKATIAFPVPDEDKLCYFDPVDSGDRKPEVRDLSGETRMECVLEDPKLVGGVAKILGVSSARWMIVFLPQELEETLLEKELAFQSRDEREIKSTEFEVAHGEAGYHLRVVKQTFR